MKAYKNGYTKKGIIALCSLVYFVSYFSRKDFAAVMAGMITDGAVDRANAGLIGTMLFIFYGVGQLLSGYLGDKIKPKYLIVIGLSSTAVCNALMPLIPEGMMIVVWGVNGLAQAMLWPPIVKILSTYLDHKTFVTANLVVTSAAHVATILLYVFVPLCLTFMSWETVFFTASVLAACSIVIFVAALGVILPKNTEEMSTDNGEERTETSIDKVHESENLMSALKRSGVVTVFICIIVCGFLRDGIESWLPTLYSEAFDRDVSESTLLSIILPIFSIISISAVTALHKRRSFNNEVKGTAILLGAALLCAIPLAFFVGMQGKVFGIISLLLTALICAAMHGVNFLLISCLPGRFASIGRSATVSGVCNSCIYIGAAISTYGIALISEKMGWSLTIVTWCLILIIGIVFAFLSLKKYASMINEKAESELQ